MGARNLLEHSRLAPNVIESLSQKAKALNQHTLARLGTGHVGRGVIFQELSTL